MARTGPKQAQAKETASVQPAWQRWMPVAILGGLMVLIFAMGWYKYLSLQTIGQNYGAIRGFIEAHFIVAVLVYAAVYIAVVALSLPGGAIMTLAGGLLFGALFGVPIIVIAATIGATIIFLIAKSSFGAALGAKAGPSLEKLRAGFQDNAMSYMLFLRLVPAFPFVIVNLAPALLGVSTRTYVLGTLFGIIPGTTAYTLVGASLGAPLEAENARFDACVAAQGVENCTYHIEFQSLISRELIFAGIALGIVAMMPVLFKWMKKRKTAHVDNNE